MRVTSKHLASGIVLILLIFQMARISSRSTEAVSLVGGSDFQEATAEPVAVLEYTDSDLDESYSVDDYEPIYVPQNSTESTFTNQQSIQMSDPITDRRNSLLNDYLAVLETNTYRTNSERQFAVHQWKLRNAGALREHFSNSDLPSFEASLANRMTELSNQ